MNQSKKLERQADALLNGKRRKTRRGKKKKPAWVLKRQEERAEALRQHKRQARERWEQYQEFLRKIHD